MNRYSQEERNRTGEEQTAEYRMYEAVYTVFDGFPPKYEPIISHLYPNELRQYLFSTLVFIGKWKEGGFLFFPFFFF